MSSGGVVLLLFVSLFVSGFTRGPPHVDLAEKYFENNGFQGSRFSNNIREDARLDVPNLIRKYGYPCEVHEVTTEDGYILEMHRIPYGRDENDVPGKDRPVVFVMHGLMASSADYIIMGPGTALGYTLADGGFDVWMGNARGTHYSKRHVTLSPRDIDFWQFSWEEIGLIDVPAMIDYALATTNKTRLHYIGHSQGTTVFWVMGSLKPEYNDKIISMQAFAPVAYLEYHKNPFLTSIAPFANSIESIGRALGFGELISRNIVIRLFGTLFCQDGAPTQPLCNNLIFFIAGTSTDNQFNTTMYPVKLAHAPGGASVRQIAHYGQFINKNLFRRYNHNMLTNWFKYGSFTPPDYDLSKITAPVYMHHVDNDVFADLRDMDKLWNQLGNPVAKIRVPYDGFSHLDFAWGQHAKSVLYDNTVEIMKSLPEN
ncbi:hypothetical protein O0L34_g11349 [Tuta absoluta]|nr:hypothetical protein O0L34_g11349 [Tuta absoluta]